MDKQKMQALANMLPSVDIWNSQGFIDLRSPYHPELAGLARSLGGDFDKSSKHWKFPKALLNQVQLLCQQVFGYTNMSVDGLRMMGYRLRIGPAMGCDGSWLPAPDSSLFFAGLQIARRVGGQVRLHALNQVERNFAESLGRRAAFSTISNPGVGGGWSGPIMGPGDKPVELVGVGVECKVLEEFLRHPSTYLKPLAGDLKDFVPDDLGEYGNWILSELRAMPAECRDSILARLTIDDLARGCASE